MLEIEKSAYARKRDNIIFRVHIEKKAKGPVNSHSLSHYSLRVNYLSAGWAQLQW